MEINGIRLTPENWEELLNPQRLTGAQMIDILGELKDQAKFLSKLENFLKETLPLKVPTSDRGEFQSQGQRYVAIRAQKSRTALDAEKVRTEMGETWYKEHCKTTEYYELRVKELKDKPGD